MFVLYSQISGWFFILKRKNLSLKKKTIFDCNNVSIIKN
jgi:hypothetical protein